MRILVIGGTYFLGKAFVTMACSQHELTLLNRGTRSVDFPHPENIKYIICDRHDVTDATFATGSACTAPVYDGASVPAGADKPGCAVTSCKNTCHGSSDDIYYDAVIDFCAYGPGDIMSMADALSGKIGRYVYISTTDVYKRGTGQTTDETGELESRDFGGDAGQYILGKAALERELDEVACKYGIRVHSVRPAFIYGPDNYAPREGIFFTWINKAGQIIFPEGSDGTFQMVYVSDVAASILALTESDTAVRSINITGDCVITYESFADALKTATGVDFERAEVPVDVINERGIPLPFPLTAAESETYTTLYKDMFIKNYTPLAEGLKISYDSFIMAQDIRGMT